MRTVSTPNTYKRNNNNLTVTNTGRVVDTWGIVAWALNPKGSNIRKTHLESTTSVVGQLSGVCCACRGGVLRLGRGWSLVFYGTIHSYVARAEVPPLSPLGIGAAPRPISRAALSHSLGAATELRRGKSKSHRD